MKESQMNHKKFEIIIQKMIICLQNIPDRVQRTILQINKTQKETKEYKQKIEDDANDIGKNPNMLYDPIKTIIEKFYKLEQTMETNIQKIKKDIYQSYGITNFINDYIKLPKNNTNKKAKHASITNTLNNQKQTK